MVLVWVYGLTTNKEGNFVKKNMRDCTGEEICREWLYHIGVPAAKIEDLAKNACNTTTAYMPFITAFFQPRKNEDRPKVVPTIYYPDHGTSDVGQRFAYYFD